LSEEWNSPADARGYYSYFNAADQTHPIGWLPDHGANNTGFVFCSLEPLEQDGFIDLFYPLWTFGWTNLDSAAHPVSLTCSPYVTLSVNAIPLGHLDPPHTLMANLNGGSLRFFVGTFETANRYAFFVFKAQSFDIGTGEWTTSTIQVTSDEAAWDRFVPSQPDGPLPVLQKVLDYPQQWGFCIDGATAQPTGWLGFDNLALTQGSLSRFPTNWYVPDDFPTIQHAIVNPKVIWGDTILVRKLDLPYPGQISTKVRDSETDFLPSCPKRLTIRAADKSSPPVLIYQQTLPPSTNHVWLEFGGEFSDFILQGPGLIANGIGIANPTLVRGCVVTNYYHGCLAFCAANAIDEPSGFRYNLIGYNKIGVSNGDVEHIYLYNLIAWNGIGASTTAGSRARFVNNLIVSNLASGVEVRQYGSMAPNQTEIANNNIVANGGDGVRMVYALPAVPNSHPAMPNCPLIRDNIIALNQGFAIHAVDFDGTPVLWETTPACPIGLMRDDTGRTWPVGGCYPKVDYNCFWKNHGESADLADHFFSTNIIVDGLARTYRTVPFADFGQRFLFIGTVCTNPAWSEDWYLQGDSLCIDAGSLTLSPGSTRCISPDRPLRDAGVLDIGYHHPVLLNPNLAVRHVNTNVLTIDINDLTSGELYKVQHVFTPDWSKGGAITFTLDPRATPATTTSGLGFFWLGD
jgi:hypothetical protein